MWPGWVDLVASVSHLALTVSSSLSFYIYFALYGAKHEVGVVQTIKCKWHNIWRMEREVNMVSSITIIH